MADRMRRVQCTAAASDEASGITLRHPDTFALRTEMRRRVLVQAVAIHVGDEEEGGHRCSAWRWWWRATSDRDVRKKTRRVAAVQPRAGESEQRGRKAGEEEPSREGGDEKDWAMAMEPGLSGDTEGREGWTASGADAVAMVQAETRGVREGAERATRMSVG